MELLQEAFVAFFAAAGIAALVHSALCMLLFARGNTIRTQVILAPQEADAPVLEQTLSALQESTVCGKRPDAIWIDTSALSEEERRRACLLARRKGDVRICITENLREHIT